MLRTLALSNESLLGMNIKITKEQLAAWLNPTGWRALLPLMERASALVPMPEKVELCAIANIGFGSCEQNCAFCAQNSHSHIDPFTLSPEEITDMAYQARERGATRFSLVATGGYCPEGERLRRICKTIETLSAKNIIKPCASLGMLNAEQALRLYEAGLVRYHHNIETGPDFFAQVCTSHTWQERWQTNITARNTGLEICCGGLIGLGESFAQRAEMALYLGELAPDSIPLNFYIPINGQLGNNPLTPLQALAACAVLKIASPRSAVRLCGGREQHLGALSSMAHLCGIEALMIGNYLTTAGVEQSKDTAELIALMRTPIAAG